MNLEEILAPVEGPIRLVLDHSITVNFETGQADSVVTVHMYEEPANPRNKAKKVAPVLVGNNYKELLSAIAETLDGLKEKA